MIVRTAALTDETLGDVVCCPGGLEVRGKDFRGDPEETLVWRRRMIGLGLRGIVAYDEDGPRGFAETMPAEAAPIPVHAPGAAALLCYRWAGTEAEDPEHLERERALIEQVIVETRGGFTGLLTQGWDVPTHFPIPLLEELGFREVDRRDQIALMWLPYRKTSKPPTMVAASHAPRDLSADGLLAIDAAFSARCPYSLYSEAHLRETVSTHPLRSRIRLDLHRIDSREDALAFAVPPFDWAWVFLNGDEVSLFELPREKLSAEITRRMAGLGS